MVSGYTRDVQSQAAGHMRSKTKIYPARAQSLPVFRPKLSRSYTNKSALRPFSQPKMPLKLDRRLVGLHLLTEPIFALVCGLGVICWPAGILTKSHMALLQKSLDTLGLDRRGMLGSYAWINEYHAASNSYSLFDTRLCETTVKTTKLSLR